MTTHPRSDIKEDELPPPPEGEGAEGTEGTESGTEGDDLPPPPEGDKGAAGEGEAGADTGDGPLRKKKNRTNFKARIGQEVAKRTAAEEAADAYKRELEELRGQKGESDATAIAYGRRSIENEIKLLTRDLKEATESADAAASAEITNKLAAANAQLARFPQPRKAAEEEAPAPKTVEKQPAEEERGEEVQEHLQAIPGSPKHAWLENNAAWLDPQSPDYDPGMETVARRYATSLEQDLLAKKRPDLIGSQWYFDRIDRQMATAFPQEYEMPTERQPPARGGTPPMRRENGAVATPSRPGGGGGDRRLPDLSAEEKEVALMMGAGKKHDNGKPYTDAEKLASYALHKKNPNAGAVAVSFRGRNGG